MAPSQDDDPDTISRIATPLFGRRRSIGTATAFERFVAWLTAVGEVAGEALLYSSVYLAVIAMVYVSIPMVLLSLPPNPAPVVVGLVAFAVYANDRILDVDDDELANPDRAAFVRRNRRLLHLLAATAYGIAVAISVLGGPLAMTITLVPGVFWILYATDWVPWVRVSFGRLKEVLVVNSAVVALAWALSATFLPLAFAGMAITEAAAVVFGYFLLRSFVNTEIPNVRDIESDRMAAVSTLPVVLGIGRTRRVLYAMDALAFLLVTGAVLEGLLPALPALGLLAGLCYSVGIAFLIGRMADLELLALASEFEYVVTAIAIAIALTVG